MGEPTLWKITIYYSVDYKKGIFGKRMTQSGIADMDWFYFSDSEEEVVANFFDYFLSFKHVVRERIVDRYVYVWDYSNIEAFEFTEFQILPEQVSIYDINYTLDMLKDRMPAPDFIHYCEYIRKSV